MREALSFSFESQVTVGSSQTPLQRIYIAWHKTRKNEKPAHSSRARISLKSRNMEAQLVCLEYWSRQKQALQEREARKLRMGHCNLRELLSSDHAAESSQCAAESAWRKRWRTGLTRTSQSPKKGKLVLYLEWNNPITAQSVSKLARKDLQFLMHSKLNMSQQCALTADKPSDLVDCICNTQTRMWKRDYSSLLSKCESVSEVLRPVLVFSALEKTSCTGLSPVEVTL